MTSHNILQLNLQSHEKPSGVPNNRSIHEGEVTIVHNVCKIAVLVFTPTCGGLLLVSVTSIFCVSGVFSSSRATSLQKHTYFQ